MVIKAAGQILDKYNEVKVSSHYNAVASTFMFKIYFDPNNSFHKQLLKPFAYHKCEIWHENILILTGVILSADFSDGATPELVTIQGYSLTGVLEDCPVVKAPLQSTNLSLKDIAEACCLHYGIKVVVDPEVSAICDTKIPESTPDVEDTVKKYLDKLCAQRNVILSHTNKGELLLTKSKSGLLLTNESSFVKRQTVPIDDSLTPVDFTAPTTETPVNRAILHTFKNSDRNWTKMHLLTNGQKMHSDIVVMGQATNNDISVQSPTLVNPYVPVQLPKQRGNIGDLVKVNTTAIDGSLAGAPSGNTVILPDSAGLPIRGLRPTNKVQSSGDVNTTEKAARNLLAEELKSMVLTIDVIGWTLGGNLITPNQLIAVINPNCYLYKQTKFFIQDVDLMGDEKSDTARITAVVPEAYNNEVVKNIFN